MTTARGILRELRQRRVPAWWQDAKLGIFVHWTPASVPAFAPVDMEIGALLQSGRKDALAWSPYTEWYENSVRVPESPAARHHRDVHGNRPYADFVAMWEAGLAEWNPDEWARVFAATGARYVVLVAKHHDGYCLWPTHVTNSRRPGWNADRDVVGELAEAVRAAGMRFGVYYSGGLDWTFDDRSIGSFSDMLAAIPRGDYVAYADAQVRELIARYRPSVLWNDIAWPSEGRHLWPLFAYYYDHVPDGVVNDRWMPWSPLFGLARTNVAKRVIDAGVRRQGHRGVGIVPPKPPHFDVRTPEYARFAKIERTPWECVRGIDQSFGYNAQSKPEHFLSRVELLWSFIDIVAKGGNLLLNVGPRGVDARIPPQQRTRLDWLGAFFAQHRAALSATRPWTCAGDTTKEGAQVRYTTRDEMVFAFVREARGRTTLAELTSTPTTAVETMDGTPRRWHETESGIELEVGDGTEFPAAFVMRDVAARGRR